MTDQNVQQDEQLENKFERLIANATGVSPVFPHAAKEQMRAMIEQIARADSNLAGIRSTDQSVPHKAGFAAEEWHAETFNLDAILKNDSTRAYTDKYRPEFSEAGYKTNAPQDIVITKDGTTVGEAQVKYYKDAESTYKAMRSVDENGTIKYEGMDLIGPSDQIQDVQTIAGQARAKEHAKGTRPAVEKAAGMVEDKAAPTVESGNVGSKSLSNEDAKEIARNDKAEIKTKVENEFKTRSTVKKMGEAAAGAAAMSAVIAGSINIVTYAKQVHAGKITPGEAAIKIAAETAAAAADSAVKAAAVTGAQSLIVRYGTHGLVKKMAGQGLGALTRSNAVTVAAVCSIDLIKDLVQFSAGKITAQQLQERSGKNLLNTSAGVFGGTLGALAVGGLAAGTFAAGAVPIIASVAGGIICSMAMDLAIENGIEAPYRELVSNAASLRDSAVILEEVSQEIFEGQVTFGRFLEADRALDKQFDCQVAESAGLTTDMRRSIDRI